MVPHELDLDHEGLADVLPDSLDDPRQALGLVYEELRRLARGALGRRGRISLDSGDLVAEACLRLGRNPDLARLGRDRLLALGGVVIRRVLVDLARKRSREKRGGDRIRVELHSGIALDGEPAIDPLVLEEAMGTLQEGHPRWARVVELHGFAGLGLREVAEILDRPYGGVRNDWRMARAWLMEKLEPGSTA